MVFCLWMLRWWPLHQIAKLRLDFGLLDFGLLDFGLLDFGLLAKW